MPDNLAIDKDFIIDILVSLLDIPSPTGYTSQATQFLLREFETLGFAGKLTRKGSLLAEWPGCSDEDPRAISAHVDTLGAMVKEIKTNGRLKMTKIGGFAWNTIEGEGCRVITASDNLVRGSILLDKSSVHVFGQGVSDAKRDEDSLEVRLDERTSSEEETRALGIEVGDFIAFDPRVEVSQSGFIRSRHLDDKACVACMLGALKGMKEAGLAPSRKTYLQISSFEEVGHGAATASLGDIAEFVALDMAAIGEGQASDEFHLTICVKDSSGPYHHTLTRDLIQLAKEKGIQHKIDIYPYYGSDGSAFWRAGGDAKVALFGPGVDASHNYERTHIESLLATAQLTAHYLLSD